MSTNAAEGDTTRPVHLRVDKVEVEVKSSGDEKKASPGKDPWDKFASVSTFLSGIVVALVGIAATAVYNSRQLESQRLQKDHELAIQRVQTVEKFLPHLASTDQKLRLGALDAIAALGDEPLATRLAKRFGGEGGVGALAGLTRSADPVVAESASRGLTELLGTLRSSVIVLESGESRSFSATGFFVSADGLAVVPSFALVDEPYRAKLVRDGLTYSVELVRKDDSRSLALVRIKVPSPVMPISLSTGKVSAGDQIIALGDVPSQGWVSLVGHITGAASGRLLSDLHLQRGMAGTPVVNARSELVGMAIASDAERRIGILVPGSEIAEFTQSK